MLSAKTRLVMKSALVLGVVPVLIWAHSEGPDAGHTGAPGDETCGKLTCHVGSENPTVGRGIEIDFPNCNRYTPGVRQRWTVRVTGAQTRVYGFQVSARVASAEQSGQAGMFFPVDGATQVICQDNRPRRGVTPCNAANPIEFIEHTSPNPANTFTIEWEPPSTDVGEIRIFAAGNASNASGDERGDQIFTNSFTMSPASAPAGPPTIGAVLQSFSGKPAVSSGTWIELYGSNLAGNTCEWGGADFNGSKAPEQLSGVKVNVNGKPAFVRFTSAGQVNVQAPDDDATGNVNVEVETSAGKSPGFAVPRTKVSPALLAPGAFNVGGKQYVVALFQDFATYVGRANLIAGLPFRPARPGEVITIFAVGCGATNPTSPAGEVVSGLKLLASPLTFSFGGGAAQAQGFLAPGALGLCQLNITVPAVTGDANGDVQVDATLDGVSTGQTLFTTVQR